MPGNSDEDSLMATAGPLAASHAKKLLNISMDRERDLDCTVD
jgi:hypothetical protein